jgi:cytochrome c-type protein NapB
VRPSDPQPRGWWLLPLFLSASALTAIAAVVVAVERAPLRRAPEPAPAPAALLRAPGESIAGEAQVFRTGPAMMAIPPDTRRAREAHPRTLKAYHYLRAYPGAPPRIPHELTPEEFRTSACNTCHERGGYSRRFDAYVPLTPHPDQGPCLQCHLGTDNLMAVSSVSPDPNRRCHQCHATGGLPRPQAETPFDWLTTTWPRLPPPTVGEEPPPILHAGEPRGNCIACHAGPAAVAEVRTSHPEWANCRQCHVALDPEAGAFSRTASAGAAAAGGSP